MSLCHHYHQIMMTYIHNIPPIFIGVTVIIYFFLLRSVYTLFTSLFVMRNSYTLLAIAEVKQDLEVLRASEGTLSRWSRLYLQSLAPTNPHWIRVVDYGPFSLCVIHKEGLCPSSGDINRPMMMMMNINLRIFDIRWIFEMGHEGYLNHYSYR
jgi:hypothetical protein